MAVADFTSEGNDANSAADGNGLRQKGEKNETDYQDLVGDIAGNGFIHVLGRLRRL
jgi:hypothetical protein